MHAPLAVQFHVVTVVPAALIGTWQIFFSRKGAPLHRTLGYVYMVLMLVTAFSTLWVHQLMPSSPFFGLSPIHLLIPVTVIGILGGLRGAWTHNIALHRRAMLSGYFGAILLAGSLTFLPGRIMYAASLGR